MKRQKRNLNERAYSRGYQAGVSGKSRSDCPHETAGPRDTWLTGWREGREDHWNGFNSFAQAQKLSNM